MTERSGSSPPHASDAGAEQIGADDVETLTTAVLNASRLLVAIAARSLAAAQENVTLPQFRAW